jgi:hypothetical protein
MIAYTANPPGSPPPPGPILDDDPSVAARGGAAPALRSRKQTWHLPAGLDLECGARMAPIQLS